jgi:hypothetical protein
MTIDGYGAFVVAERGLALVLCLMQTWRARNHETEARFDYRRRAVFAYSLNCVLVGSLFVSGLNVLLPELDNQVSRWAIGLGVAAPIMGYILLLLGWPGERRHDGDPNT